MLGNLKAVSRWLDHRLGRFFTQDASAVQRIFIRPRDQHDVTMLYVDDLAAAPTEVIIDKDNDGSFADETALASSDYELRPLNADKGPEPGPYTAIYATHWGDEGGWPAELRIRVTAQYGWPAVPPAIRDATIELAGLLRIETPRSTSRIAEGLTAVERTSADAQRLLRDLIAAYKHPRAYFA